MIGKSHGEMQHEHYKTLRENPTYRMEFMMDVLREEIMMNMPILPDDSVVSPSETSHVEVRHIYHHINPTTGKLLYLEEKVKELLPLKEKVEELSKKKKQYTKYI